MTQAEGPAGDQGPDQGSDHESDQAHAFERVGADSVPAGRPTWVRTLVAGAAACAVLLVGATLGLFLAQTLTDDEPSTPGAGSVEVGFAQDMSVHHLQAVTMANWARDHSTDAQIKQLAFDIESTQSEQVGRMKGWLMLWDQPEQATGAYMTWMTGPGGHQHGANPSGTTTAPPASDAPMPGMATQTELSKLRSLSGAELDVYFLQLMLRHHQGGTGMAQYAQDHSDLPAVKQLTHSMLASQGSEITLMTQMLAARGATPLPAP